VSKANKRERQRVNREARRQYQEALAKRRRLLKTLRNLAIAALPVVAVGAFLTLSKDDTASAASCTKVAAPAAKATTFPTAPAAALDATKTYSATFDTNCGSFTVTLDAPEAPRTVNSFVFLAKQGFYDGLSFHRVAKDFVVQGGDPKGDGTGGPGYTLPDEPPAKGYTKGSVAMANSGTGTSGSQFFIVTTAKGAKGLGGPPYAYSILGQVTSGMDTIDKMNAHGSTAADAGQQKPDQVLVMKKVTIDDGSAAAATTTTTSTTKP
jgi:cyclophilin family peptidyl-prolyl cis-trans isomerase